MKLTVTEAAKKRLNLDGQAKLLLSYDDGVGQFSSVGVCSLDTAFQLIKVDPELEAPDYDLQLDSNIGPIFIKGYSKQYLGENLKLDFDSKFFTLPLSSDSEMIDSNVQVMDLTKVK
jgi:uncharacterized protein YqkB